MMHEGTDRFGRPMVLRTSGIRVLRTSGTVEVPLVHLFIPLGPEPPVLVTGATPDRP